MGIVDEFFELKEESNADLLAMQVGDFYEFFADDAHTVSSELGLKVSEKSSHGSSYAMAGVPIDDLEQYLVTLVENKNYTVAVADQYKQNGEHKRKVSRTVTPGTLIESVDTDVRYLCSVFVDNEDVGIAFTELSSGNILVKESNTEDYIDEISVYRPSEVIITSTEYSENISEIKNNINSHFNTRTEIVENYADIESLVNEVESHYGKNIIDSIGLSDKQHATSAVGSILRYIDNTQSELQNSINKIKTIDDDDYISLDARTRRSLEIVDTMNSDAGNSLYDVMDKTITPNGSKKLRQYLQRPLKSRSSIHERQESVDVFVRNAIHRNDCQSILEEFPNIQRISSRCVYGRATPKELRDIVDGLECLDEILDIFLKDSNLIESPISDRLRDISLDEVNEVRDIINSSISEDATNNINEGTIKKGYNKELDNLIEKYKNNKEWFDSLEDEVSNKYNITHVKVDRNQTDGYYIQVGKSEADEISESEYNHIKSLKNSKRFKNEEMRDREKKFLRLEEKREKLELEVFSEILSEIGEKSEILQKVGSVFAEIDAYQSLATHAVQNKWVQPEINEIGTKIDIEGGCHPVVEQTEDFVPNDLDISKNNSFYIVTGPNMAGKSTYLRQCALIVLLAQSGSYVPAEEAEIGIVDSIFTRVGAMDEISQGRSTFMVEMSELANILHTSTDNSLVILDEVGRGTATNDGISIAKATIEYLAGNNDSQTPKTMFATHYHELTELSNEYDNIENLRLDIEKTGNGDYKFTRKVREGSANNSYGVQVADMAGVPNEVVERANEILDNRDDQKS